MLRRPGRISKSFGYSPAKIIESQGPPIFRGDSKTINALHDFIDTLQEQKGSRLTAKQTKALTKIAETLISFIEAGSLHHTLREDTKGILTTSSIKRRLIKHIPDSIHERLQNLTVSSAQPS